MKNNDVSYTDMDTTMERLCSIKDRAELKYKCAVNKYVAIVKKGFAFSNRANNLYRNVCIIGWILGYTEDKIYRDIEDEEEKQ